jgi:hypothetical protein
MSYELTQRTIAVAPEAIATLFPALNAQYGEELSYGSGNTRTIGAFWNDVEKTSIYAASMDRGNIVGQPLTDGRVAYTCLWQSDLAAAFDAGEIDGVTELTPEELAGLIPVAEVMP